MFKDDWLIQDSQDACAESTFLHYENLRRYKLGVSLTFQELVIYFRPFEDTAPHKLSRQTNMQTNKKHYTHKKQQWLFFFNCIHLIAFSQDFVWVLLTHLCNMWNVIWDSAAIEVWFLTSLKLIIQVEMQSEKKKYLWDISIRPVEKNH